MAKIFEPKPRWEGAPKICLYEGLPAFKSEKELGAYHTKFSPSCPIYRKWKCPVCNGYHFLAKEMPGAGGSSGTQRENTMHLPRAEWEGRIPPALPDATLYVIHFTAADQEKFPDAAEEIARRLRADGAPVELPEDTQLTYRRRHTHTQGSSEHFALCNIHRRRMDNGDILYGWHITTNPEQKNEN